MVSICKNEKTLEILLAKSPTEPETYAGNELLYYLERMTAKVFSITDETSANVIAIGQAAKKFGIESDFSDDDSFRIVTVNGNICITGGKRGVIYGVYELLQKLGCRFFTATCEKIPTSKNIEIDETDETQSPSFEYREHNYYEPSMYTNFAVKSRFNGKAHPISEKRGGNISYAWFVHTFEKIIPTEVYAETHPEYFAVDENGEQSILKYRNQICLTNKDVLDIAIKSVRQALNDNKQARIISISQNDWHGNCKCEKCRAIDKEEGSPSGSLIRFVNEIAQALEPEFPDVLFDTLAYLYTRKAPKITKPRHNVCVRLCSIECCFSHPFSDCDDEKRGSFMADLTAWHKMSDRIYIWDYTTCFNHYPTPHPNWRCLQPNAKTFAENGVKGVFEQANGASRGGVDLNELRAYVISKLLWDVNTDVERHIQEFTDFYYGDAGVYIREYINTLCDIAQENNCHVGFNDSPLHRFLEEDCLDIYEGILNKAKAAVVSDALRFYRVEKAFLAIRYVRLKRKAMLQNIHDADEINKFFEDWQGFGLTRIEEWCQSKTTHKALLRDKWTGASLYSFWNEEGAEEL